MYLCVYISMRNPAAEHEIFWYSLASVTIFYPFLNQCFRLIGRGFVVVGPSSGQVLPSNQSNNLYVFPGLALGAKLCQAKLVRKGGM